MKLKIQKQFFDEETGWFYDTNLDGTEFIKVMGCEGWTALWANVASQEQAKAVKNNMMDTEKFNGFLPFQTLSADHPKFKPEGGYWRGPIWIDQCYFGIAGL
ncbi:MAG: trehalase, partial [Crocinitomicaceae bacterium]|nr:trehalase [Crocinitomicaceae bacterium]